MNKYFATIYDLDGEILTFYQIDTDKEMSVKEIKENCVRRFNDDLDETDIAIGDIDFEIHQLDKDYEVMKVISERSKNES